MTWWLENSVYPTLTAHCILIIYADVGGLCGRQLWDEGRPYRVQLDNGAALLLR
jgi:hypothetical protein